MKTLNQTIVKQYEDVFFNWLKENDIKLPTNDGVGYNHYSDIEIENFNEFVDENELNDIHDFTFRIDATVKSEHEEETNSGYDKVTDVTLKVYIDGVTESVLISKQREKELLKSVYISY